MLTRENITLAIAILGVALGVLNYWRSISKDKIHLRVIPKHFNDTTGGAGVCVSITNLGFLPATVSEVGIMLRDGNRLAALHSYGTNEMLPKLLEPRTSFTFYFAPGTHKDPRIADACYAYAWTACDRKIKGKSKALKSMIKKARLAS